MPHFDAILATRSHFDFYILSAEFKLDAIFSDSGKVKIKDTLLPKKLNILDYF